MNNDLLNHDLLSIDETMALFMAIEIGQAIREEKEAGDEIDSEGEGAVLEGETAKMNLVFHNMRLGVGFMRRASIPVNEDNLQNVTLGLIEAINRFDRDYGVRFDTYAWWWFKNVFGKLKGNTLVSLTYRESALASKLKAKVVELTQKMGREPTNAELAIQTGLEAGFVYELINATYEPLSLDAPINQDPDNDSLLEEHISSSKGPMEDERLQALIFMEKANIPSLAQTVILMKMEGYTFEQISSITGISLRHANYLYRRSFNKLKEYCNEKKEE